MFRLLDHASERSSGGGIDEVSKISQGDGEELHELLRRASVKGLPKDGRPVFDGGAAEPGGRDGSGFGDPIPQACGNRVVAAVAWPLAEVGKVPGSEVYRVEREHERSRRLGITKWFLTWVVGLAIHVEPGGEIVDPFGMDLHVGADGGDSGTAAPNLIEDRLVHECRRYGETCLNRVTCGPNDANPDGSIDAEVRDQRPRARRHAE